MTDKHQYKVGSLVFSRWDAFKGIGLVVKLKTSKDHYDKLIILDSNAELITQYASDVEAYTETAYYDGLNVADRYVWK